MLRQSSLLTFLLAPVLCAPLLASGAPEYSITTFAKGTSLSGINNAGQVIGTGSYGAVTVTGGTATRLDAPGNLSIYGTAINDTGDVLVQHYGPSAWTNLLLSGGTATELGSLGYSQYTSVSAINNAGQVTGSSGHAFLYQRGSGMTDLGTLGGANSWGNGLNSAGTVVGGATRDATGRSWAFIYTGGSMRDLGSLGGVRSEAYAVNDSDVAVGWANRPGLGEHLIRRAVLFANGTVTELDALGSGFSDARDINNAGDIVGAFGGASGGSHAFVYRDGKMIDLNSLVDPASGFVLSGAYAINDSRQILAYAYDPTVGTKYGYQSVLLSLSPVPEPDACITLLIGLGLIGATRLRRSPLFRQVSAAGI